MCNYQLQKLDCIIKIKKILKNEKIISFNMNVGHDILKWRKDKIRSESYYINKNKGGGVIFELIHEINLINFIFGDFLKLKTFKKNTLQKFNCEDVAISIIKMKKNILGSLYQDMVSPIFFRKLDIICKNNYYEIDLIKNEIIINKFRKIRFKKNNQLNLIKKNIIYYINFIKNKHSLKFYDEAINDLKIVMKMHDEI
jgi:predicted dehydrogenase